MSEPQPAAPLLDEAAFARMREERIRFLEMVADVRAELHRYCARMVGSAADGEDIVQDALARAYYELAGLREAPAMRAGCFASPTTARSTGCAVTRCAWASRWRRKT